MLISQLLIVPFFNQYRWIYAEKIDLNAWVLVMEFSRFVQSVQVSNY